MTDLRPPMVLFALTAALLAALIGCSHPLEVDVPADYHGKVTVLCTRLADDGRPIHVGEDGTAKQATCPRSRQTLVVVRDGKAVKPAAETQWSTTGDGIVLAFDFNVD